MKFALDGFRGLGGIDEYPAGGVGFDKFMIARPNAFVEFEFVVIQPVPFATAPGAAFEAGFGVTIQE